MINLENKYLNLYKLLSLVFSTIFLILLILTIFLDRNNNEWESHQQAYKEILNRMDIPDVQDEIAALKGNIRQIHLPAINRTDRCVSCHLSVDNPYMKDKNAPLGYHPAVLSEHEISRFGCSLCHWGQGNALNNREAHAREGKVHWDKPLLNREMIESSCGHCHLAVFSKNAAIDSTKRLVFGKNIFKREGCLGCHKVRSVGGSVGPDITNLGNKPPKAYNYENISADNTRENWLIEHFLRPQIVTPNSQMLKFALPEEELLSLSVFALGLSEMYLPVEYYSLETIKEFKGRRLQISGKEGYGLFCAACHGKSGQGRDYELLPFGAVSLGNANFLSVASDDFMVFTLLEGRSGRAMAVWRQRFSGLHNEELLDLVHYIKGREADVPARFEELMNSGNPQDGERLYEKYCLTCHRRDIKNPIAPSPLSEEFVQNATGRFLYSTLIDGRKNTAMPAWNKLGKNNLAHLVSFINPQKRETQPRNDLSGADVGNGQALFHYLCKRCHGGHGEGNAGPATLNRSFLKTVSVDFLAAIISQGKKHTPMFGWMKKDLGEGRLSEKEVMDVVGFMKSMTDSIPEYIYPGKNSGSAQEGKKLYAAHCSKCHGENGDGPKAPRLNNQEFLNAASNGFLFATMTIGRDSTKMPDWGYKSDDHIRLSIENRADITGYLRAWQNIYIKNPRSFLTVKTGR